MNKADAREPRNLQKIERTSLKNSRKLLREYYLADHPENQQVAKVNYIVVMVRILTRIREMSLIRYVAYKPVSGNSCRIQRFSRDQQVFLTCEAHSSEIFAIAVTTTRAITASGENSLKVWDTKSQDHPLVHTFSNAHPLGAHHLAVDVDNGGRIAASSGFGQELVVWDLAEGKEKVRLNPTVNSSTTSNLWLTSATKADSKLDGRISSARLTYCQVRCRTTL